MLLKYVNGVMGRHSRQSLASMPKILYPVLYKSRHGAGDLEGKEQGAVGCTSAGWGGGDDFGSVVHSVGDEEGWGVAGSH